MCVGSGDHRKLEVSGDTGVDGRGVCDDGILVRNETVVEW